MLNERQIELLPERIYQRLNKINSECLESIGSVIHKIGELRPKDVHQLQQMYNYGADMNKISLKLAQVTNNNVQDIYEIFDTVAKENYNYSRPFYEAKAMVFIPYEQNNQLKKYVKSLAKQTVGEYANLTQHTAFAVFDKSGKSIAPLFESNKNKVATSLSNTYTKIVDYAVTKVQLGTDSYNSAMREVLEAMAKSGIRTVDYATGYSRRLDTAVRQNILWGVKECNQNTADLVGNEFGADGYEISYHSHPRPKHAEMGGKQYAKGKGRTVNGVYYPSFSDVEHLLEEYNCLHFKFSILLGISVPAYDKSYLNKLKTDDNKTFEFDGKEYTMYEASQLQRKIETAIRSQKDRAIIAKAAVNDDMRREAQSKINALANKYAELSKVSGLPTKMERMQVKGFRGVKVKIVDNPKKSGIIKEENKKDITIITETAINKIQKISIPGLSDEQNEYVYHQHRSLLMFSRDNNSSNEVAYVFCNDFSERFPFLGDDDSINFGTALSGKGDNIFVMHNHPRNSSFSRADVKEFLYNNSIKTLSVVKNNGGVEIITKENEYNQRDAVVREQRFERDFAPNKTNREYADMVARLLQYLEKKGFITWMR